MSKDLRTAILSFIAHLVSKDFEAVPGDLDAMGFIPAGKREAMEDAGVASAIGLLFSALAKGGGVPRGFRAELGLPDADKIKEIRKELKGVKDMKLRRDKFLEASGGADSKVAQLTRDLEGIQEKYGNIFQIPSYFGYILRSFSVLEGIGLASDKDYSTANECYPYVARRPHRRHPGDAQGARAAPVRQKRSQGSALREARQAARQCVRELLLHHQRQGVSEGGRGW